LTIGLLAAVVVVSPFTSDQAQTVVTENGPVSTVGPTTTHEFTGDVPTTIAITTTVAPTTTSSLPAGIPAGEDTAAVRVIDGDTIEVSGGTRVRFIGIDTPETSAGPDCFGPEATRYARELLPVGTTIRLVYDVERLDRFGRTLAYVYKLTDGVFVNLALARNGFAMQATFPPNVEHAEEFRAAVAAARNARLGLWGACGSAAAPIAAAPTTRATVALTPTTVAPATAAPTRATVAVTPTTAAPSSGCHSSYTGACVPTGFSDVDCAGGSGNGPGYVSGKNFRVVGPDVYGLDADGDGIACESR
jgi:micrococcal nuclease